MVRIGDNNISFPSGDDSSSVGRSAKSGSAKAIDDLNNNHSIIATSTTGSVKLSERTVEDQTTIHSYFGLNVPIDN